MFNNEELYYMQVNFDMSVSTYTKFYKIVGFKRYKKFLLWGPTVKSPIFEEIFEIYQDIEDNKFSKREIKDLITKEFVNYKKLKKREEEIEKGEII